jgi:hypothetical protein
MLISKHYWDSQIKEGGTGRTYGTHGEKSDVHTEFVRKPEGTRPLARHAHKWEGVEWFRL